MTLGQQYPNVYKLLRQGDIDVTDEDITGDLKSARIDEADLPAMEAAVIENPVLLHDGMPFPGDEPEWDAIVAKSKGLQLLQKFYDTWKQG